MLTCALFCRPSSHAKHHCNSWYGHVLYVSFVFILSPHAHVLLVVLGEGGSAYGLGRSNNVIMLHYHNVYWSSHGGKNLTRVLLPANSNAHSSELVYTRVAGSRSEPDGNVFTVMTMPLPEETSTAEAEEAGEEEKEEEEKGTSRRAATGKESEPSKDDSGADGDANKDKDKDDDDDGHLKYMSFGEKRDVRTGGPWLDDNSGGNTGRFVLRCSLYQNLRHVVRAHTDTLASFHSSCAHNGGVSLRANHTRSSLNLFLGIQPQWQHCMCTHSIRFTITSSLSLPDSVTLCFHLRLTRTIPHISFFLKPPRVFIRSADFGRTWNWTLFPKEISGATVLAVDPTNASIIFAVDPNAGIATSADRGDTWSPLLSGKGLTKVWLILALAA